MPQTTPTPQALLAAIVASSDDAIISKTLQGIVTTWNEGAERLFGYAAKEAIGKSITMLIPPDRKAEEEMILSRLRRGERVDHYETVRRAKDGRLVDISLTISPIRNDAGAVVGASKVARDISVQKRAQREREEADTRKNEFLALLAHELRNPLGPIRHAVTILRARAPSPEELHWATSIIGRQTERMTRLVDDLLDVAGISRGTLELRRGRVDIVDVLKAAVESSGTLIERARHQLSVTP
ncbi:MAG TPA: PAS domain S-box protein, partial [Gemmatimonadales bacterium]|nr:PAS domain S-box protein [Gemmatimonadales bacterium]